MSERSIPDKHAESNGAGREEPDPLISEERWEEVLRQLLADHPRAAGALAAWLLGLKYELECGPEGRARAVEALKTAIQRVEGLSSKHVC